MTAEGTAPPLLVAEPTFGDWDHGPFNAATLRAACDAFPGRAITFAASTRQHQTVLEADPALRDLPYRAIEVLPPGGVTRARFLAQWRAIRGAIRATGARSVLLLSGGPETFFVARLLVSLDAGLRLFIVLHGMGPEDFSWRSRDPRRRLFDYRAGMGWAQHPRIVFVALEEHIADALVPLLRLRRRPLVWPHPLPHDAAPVDAADVTMPVRIAFPGTVSRNKGFAMFAEAARNCAAPELAFELVGYAPSCTQDDGTAAFEAPGEPLARADYVRRLQAAHFALLPLDPAVYRLTASGTMMDCMALGLPLITTANEAALAWERQYGKVGLLFRDADELAALLRAPELLANPEQHRAFRAALGRAAAARTPEAFALRLRRDLGA